MTPWQEEFVAAVLGWIVWMGFDLVAAYFRMEDTQYAGSGPAARAAGFGARSTPYHITLRPSKNEPYVKSWGEAWALTNRLWNWPASDPDTPIQGQ